MSVSAFGLIVLGGPPDLCKHISCLASMALFAAASSLVAFISVGLGIFSSDGSPRSAKLYSWKSFDLCSMRSLKKVPEVSISSKKF